MEEENKKKERKKGDTNIKQMNHIQNRRVHKGQQNKQWHLHKQNKNKQIIDR